MSEFLGSRISLISKSDIRYSGVLHEINSEESTVSLENVKSFGTEGRRGNPDEEIAPSDQVYEYIVFRGSDVKDLRIEQPAPPKENQQPKVPDDPAIVGSRARPTGNVAPGPASHGPGPHGFGHPYQPNPFYAPPGQWGRGGPGPGPGPGFNGMPYHPPPGWFPPNQGYPAGGPGGPGPWNSFGYPPGPQGPQGPQGPPGAPAPTQTTRGTPQSDNKPAPIGAGIDKSRSVGAPAVELPTEPKSLGQPPIQPIQPASTNAAPTPPVESKPTAEEVKASVESLSINTPPPPSTAEKKVIPTGPKNNRVTPAVPIPAAILSRVGGPQVTAATASVKPSAAQSNGQPNSAAALRDATQAAKAAVAVAMAKLDSSKPEKPAKLEPASADPSAERAINGAAIDNLTRKVQEMRARSNGRGRGRGGRSSGPSRVDVPRTDFDFQAGNAKFNKQDLQKEAVATGSPQNEAVEASPSEASRSEEPGAPVAYNKTMSFFDNISSEAKDRAENGGQKPGGREWRGEEHRKNMETFGQGSVDGGYRGGYRGRGRGRATTRGRGFGGRGRAGGFQQPTPQ
ncbi:Scd6-like Sm domain-containing protein [Xylariaceae sp. FL0662B]|nr:Scd6-like Sm domain-containing protein [Xylariaceae sp. FL0662B]